MPRFLSVDYHQQRTLKAKELYTRSSLTVPCHFQDSGNQNEVLSKTTSLNDLLSGLEGENIRDFDDGPVYCLDDAEPKNHNWSVEELDWPAAWKELHGHFVEIVPSSNPESHSSFFEDDSPTNNIEICPAEEFTQQPLQSLLQGEAQMLEEPMAVSPNNQSVQESSDTAVRQCLNTLHVHASETPLLPDADQKISEADIFGFADHQLTTGSQVNDTCIASCMWSEDFHALHEFQEVKGEEFMSPAWHHQTPSSSPLVSHPLSSLLEESKSVCAQLSASPTTADCQDKETKLVDLSEICEGRFTDKKLRLESLQFSPFVKPDPAAFVTINEEGPTDVPEKFRLESPMEYSEVRSPLDLRDKCKAEAVNLTEWSPHVLTSASPFLDSAAKAKLEEHVQQKEHGFDSIQSLKLQEPDIIQDELLRPTEKPLTKALNLVAPQEMGSSLGQLELDLSWTMSPTKPLHSLSAPEALEFSDRTGAQSVPTFQPVFACPAKEMFEADMQEESPHFVSVSCVDCKSQKHGEHAVQPCNEDQHTSGRGEALKITASLIPERSHHHENVTVRNDISATSHVPGDMTRVEDLISQGNKVRFLKQAPSSSSRRLLSDILDTPLAAEQNYPASVPLVDDNQQLNIQSVNSDRENLSNNGEMLSSDDFDLQFDEDEVILSLDSFEENCPQVAETSVPAPRGTSKASPGSLFDPVDDFLMLREIKTTKSSNLSAPKGHSVVKPVPQGNTSNAQFHGIVTPMSVIPRNVRDAQQTPAQQKVTSVTLSGEFAKAQEMIASQAEHPLQKLRAEGLLSSNVTFTSLKPDITRFMLRNGAAKLSVVDKENCVDEVYQALLLVHALCSGSDLLQNCCLESAIVYFGAIQDRYTWLSGKLDGLRKELFRIQFAAQQARELHPKIAAVCREIQQQTKHLKLKEDLSSIVQILVVVRRDQPTLLKTLQSAITVDGTRTKIIPANEELHDWPADCDCLITWDQTVASKLLRHSHLVIEYEAEKTSPLFCSCKQANIGYVGFQPVHTDFMKKHTEVGPIGSESTAAVDTDCHGHTQIIGSQELLKHQDVLHLLETRYNIVVIVRDYKSIGSIHYADILVDARTGAVLIDVDQLKETGALERVTERLASLGLQLSLVWVLLHSSNGKNGGRYMSNTDMVKKAVHLQALMANLSTASEGFSTVYKVIFCKNSSDVASYIHHLATNASLQHGKDAWKSLEGCMLSHEMSQEEKFLLGIPCLNSISAQLLLSKTTLGRLMQMSEDDLQALATELPNSIIKNLHRVFNIDTGLRLYLDSSSTSDNSSCSHRDINTSAEETTPYMVGSEFTSPEFCVDDDVQSTRWSVDNQPSLMEERELPSAQPADYSEGEFGISLEAHSPFAMGQGGGRTQDFPSQYVPPQFLHSRNHWSPSDHKNLSSPRPFELTHCETLKARGCFSDECQKVRTYQDSNILGYLGLEEGTEYTYKKCGPPEGLGRMLGKYGSLWNSGKLEACTSRQKTGDNTEEYPLQARNWPPSTYGCLSQPERKSRASDPEFIFRPDFASANSEMFPHRKRLCTDKMDSDSFPTHSGREAFYEGKSGDHDFERLMQKGICNQQSPNWEANIQPVTNGMHGYHQKFPVARSETWHNNTTLHRPYPTQDDRWPHMGGSPSDSCMSKSQSERRHDYYPAREHQLQDASDRENWKSSQQQHILPRHEMIMEKRGDPCVRAWSGSISGPFSEQLAATTRRLLQGQSPGFTGCYAPHYRVPHRISIGLAQPLRRETVKESNKSACSISQQMDQSENQTLTDSPPMDTGLDCSTDEMLQNKGHISDAKFKKWSQQLLSNSSQTGFYADAGQCPVAERKQVLDPRERRLMYRPVPGAGGQTKLTFS